MKRWKHGISRVTAALIVLGLISTAAVARALPDAVDTITAEELRSFVYLLASDEMEGRDTDTLTNRIASRYLAHCFELLGLEKVDGQEDYFQYLTLVKAELTGRNRFEIKKTSSPLTELGVLGEDYFPSPLSASGKVTAPATLVGYGISAPELDYDDYAGIDVRGRIAILFNGKPERDSPDNPFDGTIRPDCGEVSYKVMEAQERGAVGVVFVQDEKDRSVSSAASVTWPKNASKAEFRLKVEVTAIRIPVVSCAKERLSTIFQPYENLATIKEEIDQKFKPASLVLDGFEVTLETEITRKETEIRNVLGYLPGSDPRLKEETVIVSAHFDHIGRREEQIFNGADDDASGTAAVLEIAEAFAESAVKPKRSLLFALWNAEERGLLGSRYYTAVPARPLEKTAALYQLDMIGRNQEVTDPGDRRFRGLAQQGGEENQNTLHLIGYSYSRDLRHLVQEQNEGVGLDLKFELDHHRLNLLRRSDHWPFLAKGIPVLFFTTGLHPDYHTSRDTPDKINYPKMEKTVRLAFLCAWATANTANTPQLSQGGADH